jgi:hypothetical protein
VRASALLCYAFFARAVMVSMSLEAIIKVSLEIRDALKTLGRRGESYDAVIRRLMEEEKAWVP